VKNNFNTLSLTLPLKGEGIYDYPEAELRGILLINFS
jgi:hypothetical protein